MKNIFLLFLSLFILNSCTKEAPQNEEPKPEEPELLSIVGKYDMNDGAHALAIKGNYVFASRDDKIFVVDVTDVTNPKAVKTIDDLENNNIFEALLVQGNLLYAGCTSTGGIYVIDITNPESPSITNKYTADIYSGAKIKPLKLFYINNILWAAGSNGTFTMLVKYTVSGSTLTADKYWLGNTTGSIAGGVWANSTHVFISTANGYVHAFNASDISTGAIDSYTFSAEAGHEHWGKTLTGYNNKLYWADWGAGVITLNISDPSNLSAHTLITHSSYTTEHADAEGTNAYDLVVNPTSGKVYVANGWSGLLQIDMSSSDKVEKFVDYKDHQYYCIVQYGKYVIVSSIAAGTTSTKGLKIIKVEE
jgi:hypothetical protein